MKRLLLLIVSVTIWLTTFAQYVNPNNHTVRGYYRKDGTYVKSYNRTNPNSTNRDNYTTKPNTNPYTGKKGYIEPENNYLYTPPTSTHIYLPTVYPTAPVPEYNALDFQQTDNNSDWYEQNQKVMTNILQNTIDNTSNYNYSLPPSNSSNEYSTNSTRKHNSKKSNYEYAKTNKYSSHNYSSNYLQEQADIDYYNRFDKVDRHLMEKILKEQGIFYGIVDGYFTNSTITSIKELQKKKKQHPTGRVINMQKFINLLPRRARKITNSYIKSKAKSPVSKSQYTTREKSYTPQKAKTSISNKKSSNSETTNINYYEKYPLATRKHIEYLLKKWGMLAGITDGQFTDKTIQAIRAWQKKSNINPTGRLSESRISLFMRMR